MTELSLQSMGKIEHDGRTWRVTEAKPHVRIMLKNFFLQIPREAEPPFVLKGGNDLEKKIEWFMQMWPLEISKVDRERLVERKTLFESGARELAAILSPEWQPSQAVGFRGNYGPYRHQAQFAELVQRLGRGLNADEMGLGKTISAIAAITKPDKLPALIVPQVHLVAQWAEEIGTFTTLTTHQIKSTRPYELPRADVYICPYTKLAGWIDYARSAGFKSVIFDEIHELRAGTETAKGKAAKAFADEANELRIGLSGTPVFNYGDDIFRIVDNYIAPGELGSWEGFVNEWLKAGREVKDPPALGSHLQATNIMVARSREDIGDDRPRPNIVVQTVPYDAEAFAEAADSDKMRELAQIVLTGSFKERGRAAANFDMRMRQATGIAKAPAVAGFCRMFLERGEPLIVCGWHRAVYEIWLRELADFNPVMFTGSESPKQKRASKEAFIEGYSSVFIMSTASGAGLNGLQYRASTAVVGELPWSPEYISQFVGRIDRPGQKGQVDAVYVVTDGGSDPGIMSLLGVKASQAHGIRKPFSAPVAQLSNDERIRRMAQDVIDGKLTFSPAARPKAKPAPAQPELF